MSNATENEIHDWVQAISTLHTTIATNPSDERAAAEAAANLWSEFGYQDPPGDVLRMFAQAIEIGYLTALRDVRNGDLDNELADWRPQ